jgi:DNA polymerase III alpha subunit
MTKNNYIKTRSFLLANVANILENINARRQDQKNDSDDLFGSNDADEKSLVNHDFWNFEFEEKNKLDILQEEKTSLGLYVSGNPLEEYITLLKIVRRNLQTNNIHLVVVEKIRKIFTKNNQMMFALQITNHEESLEGIIFPKKAIEFSPLLEEKKLYWVCGSIKRKNKSEKNEDSEDVKEYDEMSKLGFNGLSELQQGPILALQMAEANINQKEGVDFSGVNWLEIAKNPDLIKDYLNPVVKNKTAKTLTSEDNKIIIKLRQSLGAKALGYVKTKLEKSAKPEHLPICLEIETKSGFKRVKGDFWLHTKIIQKLQKFEQKSEN